MHTTPTLASKAVMETKSGIHVDLLNPTVEMIDIKDIAHHLAGINRFNGITKDGLGSSVAAHSFFVANYLYHTTQNALLAMHGLLHDAEEAYIGDITLPVKNIPGVSEALKPIRQQLESVIFDALKIPAISVMDEIEVKRADTLSLAIEARHMMYSKGMYWGLNDMLGLNDGAFYLMGPRVGESNFLAAFDYLNRKIQRH